MKVNVENSARLAYSIAEAGALTSLSRTSIWRAAKAGRIRIVKLGQRSLIPASELEKLCRVDEHAP